MDLDGPSNSHPPSPDADLTSTQQTGPSNTPAITQLPRQETFTRAELDSIVASLVHKHSAQSNQPTSSGPAPPLQTPPGPSTPWDQPNTSRSTHPYDRINNPYGLDPRWAMHAFSSFPFAGHEDPYYGGMQHGRPWLPLPQFPTVPGMHPQGRVSHSGSLTAGVGVAETHNPPLGTGKGGIRRGGKSFPQSSLPQTHTAWEPTGRAGATDLDQPGPPESDARSSVARDPSPPAASRPFFEPLSEGEEEDEEASTGPEAASQKGNSQDKEANSSGNETLESLTKELLAYAQASYTDMLAAKEVKKSKTPYDPEHNKLTGRKCTTTGTTFARSMMVDQYTKESFDKWLSDKGDRSRVAKEVPFVPKTYNLLNRNLAEDGSPDLLARFNLASDFTSHQREADSTKKARFSEEAARRMLSITHFEDRLLNLATAANVELDPATGAYKWKAEADPELLGKVIDASKEALRYRAQIEANLLAASVMERREAALSSCNLAADVKRILLQSPLSSPGLFGEKDMDRAIEKQQSLASTQGYRAERDRTNRPSSSQRSNNSQTRRYQRPPTRRPPQGPQQRSNQKFRERSPVRRQQQTQKRPQQQQNFRGAKQPPKKN